MKVTMNIECTPDEARALMGLPDVRPMQEALMADLEERLRTNMKALAPDAFVKTWLPASLEGAEQMQKMFLAHMQNVMQGLSGAALSLNGQAVTGQKAG